MRLIVTSDSHGRESNIYDIVEKHLDTMDYFINLGDSNNGRDLESAIRNFKLENKFIGVSGNCDFYSDFLDEEIISLNGKKILICHGHRYYVKHGYEEIINRALRKKIDIVLFGHTHIPYYEFIDGIHLFNPGATNEGRYGIIDITNDGVMCINARL